MNETMFNDQDYRKHRRKKFLFAPLIIALFFGLTALVQYLWNTILPTAVHAGELTFWQSAGVLLLSRILFGRFHFGGRGGGKGFGGPSREMREKWMNMDDEERAKFKEEFRERCRVRRR